MVPKLQAIASACTLHSGGSVFVRSMLATSGIYVVAENHVPSEQAGRIPVAGALIGWKTLELSGPVDIKRMIGELATAVA